MPADVGSGGVSWNEFLFTLALSARRARPVTVTGTLAHLGAQ
jgi:hypothetical protein